jgi:hypothetical protein
MCQLEQVYGFGWLCVYCTEDETYENDSAQNVAKVNYISKRECIGNNGGGLYPKLLVKLLWGNQSVKILHGIISKCILNNLEC